MSDLTRTIIGTRSHQMFPMLEPLEIERVRRFGVVNTYGAGDALIKIGDAGHGLGIILAGDVDVTRHHGSGSRELIVTHHPGDIHG
jgi:thioredoxin reductase (NADPH)